MVSQPSKGKMDFNSLLLEALDEAFSSLGETSKKAIYYQLEIAFNIKTMEIPNKIDEFSRALERLFGEGAKFLEILVMKSLYAKIKGTGGWISNVCAVPEVTFKVYLEIMKKNYEEASKNEEGVGMLINEDEKLSQCE
jgi:hypothetical protein